MRRRRLRSPISEVVATASPESEHDDRPGGGDQRVSLAIREPGIRQDVDQGHLSSSPSRLDARGHRQVGRERAL
jgi:hypothetical protein